MTYKSIFKTKPKKENKLEFCKRITTLLNKIEFVENNSIYFNGKNMLNCMFNHSKLNNGYSNINDILNEANPSFKDIFTLSCLTNDSITEENILVNIEIIVNCLFLFKNDSRDIYFFNSSDAFDTINIIANSINSYLLSLGYKLFYNNEEEIYEIIDNDMIINVEEINNDIIRNEVLNYYNYKNTSNMREKKKILLAILSELESKKKNIETIFGTKISDSIFNYANNFNLRHENMIPEYKSHYNPMIANLTENELLEWWDFIFTFVINIYLRLDRIKDVNINNGYKEETK